MPGDGRRVVIDPIARGLWSVRVDGVAVVKMERHDDGTWRMRRTCDGRHLASVRRDGDGGVSRSYHLDTNHLVRIVANIHAGNVDRAARLFSTFYDRHAEVIEPE